MIPSTTPLSHWHLILHHFSLSFEVLLSHLRLHVCKGGFPLHTTILSQPSVFPWAPCYNICQLSPTATTFEADFTLRSYGITLRTFPTFLSLPPSLSPPLCFYGVTAGERRRASPSAWSPCFENMWPGNNWVTTAAVQWVGLDLENDSIYFCLTACCFHSCSFYPPFRLRILLYRSGRQPDERVEHNLSINILTHIQWVRRENSMVPFFIVGHPSVWAFRIF